MCAKKLGFGLMRLPMKGNEIDVEQVNQMVDLFIENGFTYFDSAYVYHGGESEKIIKKCIVDRHPRDSFTIATKLPCWEVKTVADVDRIFQEQLERTGAGYFDYFLMHAIEKDRIDLYGKTFGIWEYLQNKKKEGLIKNLGFSFHDSAAVLEEAIAAFPPDFVQLQINYKDWEDENVQSRKCYEVCEKNNIPVVVMEPVKGGTLATLHPDVQKIFKDANPDASIPSWAIRYVASLPNVMMVLSGMSNMAQIEDNVSYMKDFKPLSESEQNTVQAALKKMEEIPTIPCTACRYCVDDCPMHINIPEIFKAMNTNTVYQTLDIAKRDYLNRAVGADGGRASDCLHCYSCEGHCPQDIEITTLLEQAAELFDK